ncbi:MAG: ADP-ribosylglycohydrolase family protein, partial [Proteobacteria bacterium]|nr:ADP-ribosylglycohydrolase family protein [Pseudomonadota bacterium]
GNPLTIDAAEFFARAAVRILGGETPAAAFTAVAEDRFPGSPLAALVKDGITAKGDESVAAIGRFGRNCYAPAAFPGVIQIVTRYENDMKEALIQAVMAGGDSAARGMSVGMLLGAHLGEAAIPAPWLAGLERGAEIVALLGELP